MEVFFGSDGQSVSKEWLQALLALWKDASHSFVLHGWFNDLLSSWGGYGLSH
jgi:hypothetical protein